MRLHHKHTLEELLERLAEAEMVSRRARRALERALKELNMAQHDINAMNGLKQSVENIRNLADTVKAATKTQESDNAETN